MRKWNTCMCRTSTGNASQLVMLLLVWPVRLLSWLAVGISNYVSARVINRAQHQLARQGGAWDYRGKVCGSEFQQWGDCHRFHSHQQFWARARGGEWFSIPCTHTLFLSTLSPLALQTRNWWSWELWQSPNSWISQPYLTTIISHPLWLVVSPFSRYERSGMKRA